MSYPYRNDAPLQPPLPPPPMLAGMGMMGGPGFENMHPNYAMNPAMMMPGMNDAPLEFNMNKAMQGPPPMQVPSMPKDNSIIGPTADQFEAMRDQIELSGMRHNTLGNDSRGSNNRRRSRERDGRRRDRDCDVDFRDRNRSDYKGRKSDSHNGRGKLADKKESSSCNSPQDSVNNQHTSSNLQSSGEGILQNTGTVPPNPLIPQGEGMAPPPPQPGMMYGGMGMYPGNMMGMMGGMMMDPSLMSMGQYGMADSAHMGNMNMVNPEGVAPPPDITMLGMGPFPVPVSSVATKDIIQLKSCSLVPPYPSSVLPTTRDKPPGCRTVFIGSLPENITEDILTEVFERCGEISSMRLSKKNFCHIRFRFEQSVDAAVFFSGYRIRIENKTDAPNCSRLHVDYAQARDDQHEWECKQRAQQREARHRERMAAKKRPPSPPPIHHYTDHDAGDICDKIKTDENFNQAVKVVISWLERGDCNKKNVNVFYSMIQSTNSHVRRLLNDKTQYEEELQRAKDEAKIKMQTLLAQFGDVEKVFAAASHKKVWDHFSKAQRKNIEIWKKQSSEIRILQLEDFLQETGGGEEMDVSDEEGTQRKRTKFDDEKLKEENDSLKCQLEAYKNEVDLMRSETKIEVDSKIQNIQQLKSRITVLESQLTQTKRNQVAESVKLKAMEAKYKTMEGQVKMDAGEKKDNKEDKEFLILNESKDRNDSKPSDAAQCLSDKEAKLIGIIATFLHVHPFGASTDYLWSYVQKMESDIRHNQLEELLRRFPTVFIQNVSGIGANLERKWIFNGFTLTDD